MQGFDRKVFFQLLLGLIFAIALGLFIYDSGSTLLAVIRVGGRALFLPLLLAIVITYVLDPAISHFESKGWNRIYAILAVYFFLTTTLGFFLYFVLPYFFNEVIALRGDIPRYSKGLVDVIVKIENFFQKEFGIFSDFQLTEKLTSYVNFRTTDILFLTVGTLKTGLSLLLLVPLFAFFFLKDGREMKRSFIRYVPNQYFESMLVILHHTHQSLGNFIRGRFLECFIVGLISFVGFYLAGLKYFWLLALVITVTNIVPVLGPVVGMVIVCFFAYLNSENLGFTAVIFSIILVSQIVDNLLLIPLLIKHAASVHIVTGLLAILIGGQVFGIIGMIIAVPLASIAKLILLEVHRQWSVYSSTRFLFGGKVLG